MKRVSLMWVFCFYSSTWSVTMQGYATSYLPMLMTAPVIPQFAVIPQLTVTPRLTEMTTMPKSASLWKNAVAHLMIKFKFLTFWKSFTTKTLIFGTFFINIFCQSLHFWPFSNKHQIKVLHLILSFCFQFWMFLIEQQATDLLGHLCKQFKVTHIF